jgi:hypothetical protein
MKHTTECLDQRELMNHAHWAFPFSKSLLINDFQFLKKPMMITSNTQSTKSPFNKKTVKKDDSLTKYLSTNKTKPQRHQASPSDCHDDEEIDTYDANFMLPKPQPQPSMIRNLDDSSNSHRTATFIHGNEQTFAQEGVQSKGLNGQTVLTESIRKWNGTSNLNNLSLQNTSGSNSLAQSSGKKGHHSHNNSHHSHHSHHSHGSTHSSYHGKFYIYFYNKIEEKLSPFAERLLAQQNEQLKFLQEQILALQVAIKSFFLM